MTSGTSRSEIRRRASLVIAPPLSSSAFSALPSGVRARAPGAAAGTTKRRQAPSPSGGVGSAVLRRWHRRRSRLKPFRLVTRAEACVLVRSLGGTAYAARILGDLLRELGEAQREILGLFAGVYRVLGELAEQPLQLFPSSLVERDRKSTRLNSSHQLISY